MCCHLLYGKSHRSLGKQQWMVVPLGAHNLVERVYSCSRFQINMFTGWKLFSQDYSKEMLSRRVKSASFWENWKLRNNNGLSHKKQKNWHTTTTLSIIFPTSQKLSKSPTTVLVMNGPACHLPLLPWVCGHTWKKNTCKGLWDHCI